MAAALRQVPPFTPLKRETTPEDAPTQLKTIDALLEAGAGAETSDMAYAAAALSAGAGEGRGGEGKDAGSMLFKNLGSYDPQLIKPPSGYRGADSMDFEAAKKKDNAKQLYFGDENGNICAKYAALESWPKVTLTVMRVPATGVLNIFIMDMGKADGAAMLSALLDAAGAVTGSFVRAISDHSGGKKYQKQSRVLKKFSDIKKINLISDELNKREADSSSSDDVAITN